MIHTNIPINPVAIAVAIVFLVCWAGEFVTGKIGLPRIFGSLIRQGVPAHGIRIRMIGYFAAASLASGLVTALAVIYGWSNIVRQVDFADRLVALAFMLSVVAGVTWKLPPKKI